jgi:hypothetical protein
VGVKMNIETVQILLANTTYLGVVFYATSTENLKRKLEIFFKNVFLFLVFVCVSIAMYYEIKMETVILFYAGLFFFFNMDICHHDDPGHEYD